MPDAAQRAEQDLLLATRCAGGDRAAQQRLFDLHRGRVHAILYRLLGSNREIEDLIQDAFLEIFRSLPRYRGDAQLGTWIDRVTTRVAYRYFSRKRPAPVHLEAVPDLPHGAPAPDRQVLARQAARRLYAALGRLDPKYRIAFALHVIDGRPLSEVARITETTVVAAKTRVWRARREITRRAKQDPLLASFLASGDRNHADD